MKTVRRIAGHTVGIIGFGYRPSSQRACEAGPTRIIAHDYVPQTTADLWWSWFRWRLGESDYVSIHTALTDETRHAD